MLSGVSFALEEGRIVGMIGPNGAGKSTTMKLILEIIKPDQEKKFISKKLVIEVKNEKNNNTRCSKTIYIHDADYNSNSKFNRYTFK